MANKRKDLSGAKYNRLTVVAFSHKDSYRGLYWRCICECGNEIITRGSNLKSGATKSCGCLQKEVASNTAKNNFTSHGLRYHKIYKAWRNAKSRVQNINSADYPDYGGRGITMCREWLDSFEAFAEDMLPSYEDGLELERINVNGNYCKENCVWETEGVQGHNKRKRSGCTSIYMGVHFHKATGKFAAAISLNGTSTHLGLFLDEEDAAIVYDNASEDAYGDRPNKTQRRNYGSENY